MADSLVLGGSTQQSSVTKPDIKRKQSGMMQLIKFKNISADDSDD